MVRGIVNQVFKDRHTFLVEGLDIGTLAVRFVGTCAKNGQIFAEYFLDYILPTAAVAESDQLGAAKVALKSGYMLSQFICMRRCVLCGSIDVASAFFSTPSDEPQSSLGPEAISFEKSECLKDSDKSASIIISSSL